MSDDDAALLDRISSRLHAMDGLEETSPAIPARFQTASNTAWLRQQFDADPAMRREYLQAAVRHPHLARQDSVTMAIHVEPVVRHFASDGLTRPEYFKAVAADPTLILQKPAAVIANLEAVMDHYDADRPMRSEYLQAAVNQPVLLRTPPEVVIASIQAAADRLETEGITRDDPFRRVVIQPQLLAAEAEAIRNPAALQTSPSTRVDSPALYASYVDAQARTR